MNYIHLRHISTVTLVIALSLIFLPSDIFAQHYSEIYLSNGRHVRIDNTKGGTYSVFSNNGRLQSVQMKNPEEEVRIIVTFKDRPLADYRIEKHSLQKTSIAVVYASLQSSHLAFRTALNAVSSQMTAQLKSDYGYKITRDYYSAINGVAMQCKRGMIDRLLALPMVEYVSPDEKVEASLTQSVHQIRADIVQDSLGITGKGVLVGEIDTGIDYKNPALGDGYGPGYRVTGGYNFVKNDNDPMDDNGHGTHVAGIIGADGGNSLRGVAPGVKFLAVKVLDENGMGLASDVIAGIEYCLDPDGNPATNDAAGIINMSLGGAPFPENPVDSAVDNADKAGILCVVAAGNSGYEGYGTIGSPGTSKSALTVGACDSVFHIAGFSSLGPDPVNFSIKPEVVAPGVNILSTVLNNKTASESGTSMATPHVTGTAALLKQEHPLWTPEEIKAAIINSARYLGDSVSVFAQGRGCVDALNAAETKLVVEPGVISFGFDDLARSVWTDTVKLKIENFHSTVQNTRISIIDGPPGGTTLTFDKTSFSLSPGEATTVSAILTVPSSVPILSTDPFAYTGKIKVTSDSDNVNVPFSFVKATTLVVSFDLPPADFLFIVNRKTNTTKLVYTHTGVAKYIVPVPQGDSLDLFAVLTQDSLSMRNYYLVHHRIDNPAGLTYVSMSHNEATINATNEIFYDIHNNIIPADSNMLVQILYELKAAGKANFIFGLNFGFPANLLRLYFPPSDTSFYIEKTVTASQDSNNYFLSKSVLGLHNMQDISIASGSNNLFGYYIKGSYSDPYLPNPSNWREGIVFGLGSLDVMPEFSGYGYGYSTNFFPNFKGNFYFNNQVASHFSGNDKYHYSSMFFGMSYALRANDTSSAAPPILRTPDFTINEKNEAVFDQVNISSTPSGSSVQLEIYNDYNFETLEPGDTIQVEQFHHVNFPDYTTTLNSGSIFLGHNKDRYFYDIFSYGGIKQTNGVGELRDTRNLYWNVPLFKAQAFANNQAQANMQPFMPGEYWSNSSVIFVNEHAYYKFEDAKNNIDIFQILSAGHPYTILGQAGQCTADFEYKIPGNSYYAEFPSFNLLQVSVNGKAADAVSPGQNGKIRLVLHNPNSNITSAKISLLSASGNEIALPVSYAGANEYDADIPDSITDGFVDVVARVEDAGGNRCKLTASPGFYFGGNAGNIKLNALLRMTTYSLDNINTANMKVGDTLNYTISYFNYGNNAARNVAVTFPATSYFKNIGPQSRTIDSVAVNDTVHVPVRLAFLGKQQTTDISTDYSPTISWTSNGTNYMRKSDILVDIQNIVTSAADQNSSIPNRFELYQNYPNPFNPSTTIKYDIPKESRVKIDVYDILGREVATLVDGIMKAGSYRIIWNANRFASGVYLYRIEAGDYHEVKKLLLLK